MIYVCLRTPSWPTGAGATPDAGEGGAVRGTLPCGADGRSRRRHPHGGRAGRRSCPATSALPSPELERTLLEVAPRVAVERRGVVWADARGLPALRLAEALLERLGEGARAGVAATPVAAFAAAFPCTTPSSDTATRRGGDAASAGSALAAEAGGSAHPTLAASPRRGVAVSGEAGGGVAASGGEAGEGRVVVVEPGRDREFLAPLPLALLEPEARLLSLLDGVGIRSCGELAALDREAVEVRFGPEGVRLWRLARADDERRLFAPMRPERPHASLDFIDYVVSDPERLLFTANALLGSITGVLRERGEHARRLVLTLSLASGAGWRQVLRPARATASREAWLRLVRAVLEKQTIPDAITGVSFEVEATEAAAVRQGDLFDRGFATAGAVEAAIARLIESQGDVVVEPQNSEHPLLERRTAWVPVGPDAGQAGERGGVGEREGTANPSPSRPPSPSLAASGSGGTGGAAELTLQLLPEPRGITVEAVEQRDHLAPVRYRDREGWKRLVTVAGPDRVSGERWAQAFAREYFRCVTEEGVLVWLFRDGRRDAWFLHGWWD